MDKFRPPTNYSVKTNKHGYKILTELPDDVPTWTTNSGKSSAKKRKVFDAKRQILTNHQFYSSSKILTLEMLPTIGCSVIYVQCAPTNCFGPKYDCK